MQRHQSQYLFWPSVGTQPQSLQYNYKIFLRLKYLSGLGSSSVNFIKG
uniref:Uncharacterized protein n=1 Tax=Anguilla anguilla TaxID=7936 RepID=A0A0E9QW60_ANGAN